MAFYVGIKPNKLKTYSDEAITENLVKVTKPHNWNHKPSLVMIDTIFLFQENFAMVDSGENILNMFGIISVFIFDKDNELNSIVNGCNFPVKFNAFGLKIDFKNAKIPLLLDAAINKDSLMELDFAYYYRGKKNNSFLDSLRLNSFQKYFIPIGDSSNVKEDSGVAKPVIMINVLKAMDRHTKKLIKFYKNLLDNPDSEYYNKFDLYIVSYDNIFSHDTEFEIVI